MFRNLIAALFSAIVGIGAVISNSPAWGIEISTNLYGIASNITATNLTESKDVSCSTHICNAIFFEICLPGNNFCGSGNNVFKGLEVPGLPTGGSYLTKMGVVNVTLNMQLSGGRYADKTCVINFSILDAGSDNMNMTEPQISNCNWIKRHEIGEYEVNFGDNFGKVIMNKVVTVSNNTDIYYHVLGGGTCESEVCYVQLPMKYKIHNKGGSSAYDSTAYIQYQGRVGNQALTAQVNAEPSCDFVINRSKSDGSTATTCKIASVSYVKPYVDYKAVKVDMTITPAGTDAGTWMKQLYYRIIYTDGAYPWRKIENNTTSFIWYTMYGDSYKLYLRVDTSVANVIPPGNYSGTIKLDFTYQ